MAKKGMRRPDVEEKHGTEGMQSMHLEKNTVNPVPEVQGNNKKKQNKSKNH